MNWKLDQAHSSIHFSVRHLVVAKVRGQFRKWSARLSFDESDLTRSSVNLTIDVDSVDTGNADRDGSLRSEGFFDAKKFPTMFFQSRKVERTSGTTYRITGDLTIREVTKEVALDAELGGFVTDLKGARRAGFRVNGSVMRSDFGIVWNQTLETGGVAISDRVDLHVEVEVLAQAAMAA